MEDFKLVARTQGAKRILSGHPWIFGDDLEPAPDGGAGEVASLFDGQGKFLGQGFYNAKSRIAFRLVTREDGPVDRSFWRDRLSAAIRYREALGLESNARRLVFSEADGFPGLVVDDYDGSLVLQILTKGMERIRTLLVELLQEALSPKVMVCRNDAPVRVLEGLAPEKQVIAGELPPAVQIREGDQVFEVDLLEGQKTGAYLDQRENRLFLRPLARGKRVLDAFCYDGWFAIHCAKEGATEVLALEASDHALVRLCRNAELNRSAGIEPRKANCFDALKSMAQSTERFDLIVLDPPPFARRRADVPNALKAYREINRRALQCLNPGGLLFTCCCSHGVSQDRFAKAVAEAAARTRRRLVLLEQRLQALDHPILFNEPESLYLKAMLFRSINA